LLLPFSRTTTIQPHEPHGMKASASGRLKPQGFKGEFDNYDPIGLIGGALIKADCSINWRDQNGKIYCFASGTSLVYFQDLPKDNIRKASEAFERLTRPKPGSYSADGSRMAWILAVLRQCLEASTVEKRLAELEALHPWLRAGASAS
jgi:hypothetical protein